MEKVILVNEKDEPKGLMEKMEVHRKGLLHRAFSVFIFNDQGELLIHQRARGKYHSGGLWTNTCCSHPKNGETTKEAAHRRLKEEMGFDVPLEKAFQTIYKGELDQGMTEHELDHVYLGRFHGTPNPNPNEMENWKFSSLDSIKKEIQTHPENFTLWFKILLEKVEYHL